MIRSGSSVGVLCGDCSDGKGVSVQLNRCVSCHSAYSVLIALLGKCVVQSAHPVNVSTSCYTVVCDVVVFVALLLLLSEMPAWLYPCLFYLQVCLVIVYTCLQLCRHCEFCSV